MSVRAKMRVTEVRPYPSAESSDRYVSLMAVYSTDPTEVNHSWSKATPCGQVMLTITNPGAYDQFELGKEYFIDFTKVEE